MFYFLERLYVDFYFVFVSLWYRLIITVAFPPQNKQDLDREDEVPSNVQQAPFPEVFELKKKEDMERKKGDTTRHRNLQKHGFEGEHSGEILF